MNKFSARFSSRQCLFIILLVAFVIRLFLAFNFSDKKMFWDAWDYEERALNILQGQDFGTLCRTPLYPAFIASIYFFTGRSRLAVRIVQALLGALTALIIYLIAKNLFNRKVGFIAATIFAVYPRFIWYTGNLLTETLFTFLVSLTMLALFEFYDNPSYRKAVISGLCLGFAVLCRPTAGILLPFIFIWFVIGLRRVVSIKFLAASFVLLSVSFFCVVFPWVVRNGLVRDKWILCNAGGINFWVGNSERAVKVYITGEERWGLTNDVMNNHIRKIDETPAGDYYKKGLEFLKKDPKLSFNLLLHKGLRFWMPCRPERTLPVKLASSFAYLPILILAVVGAVFSRQHWQKLSLLYMSFVAYTLLHALILSDIRFRVPLITPYLIVLASFAIFRLTAKDSLKNNMSGNEDNSRA